MLQVLVLFGKIENKYTRIFTFQEFLYLLNMIWAKKIHPVRADQFAVILTASHLKARKLKFGSQGF
jgi:hypothetical protein